jgi:hypothetical protein
MIVSHENNRKLLSIPMMGIVGLLVAFKADSTSSIVSGFYADGYAVDLFMLAIAIAFIAALIVVKFKSKQKS